MLQLFKPALLWLVVVAVLPPQWTWFLQESHLGTGRVCYSSILMLFPQCFQLKWLWGPFQVKEDPGHSGKGQGHYVVLFGNMPLYTRGSCSVLITGSRFQYIDASVPCILPLCAVMDPAVSSTLHSGHSTRVYSVEWNQYILSTEIPRALFFLL